MSSVSVEAAPLAPSVQGHARRRGARGLGLAGLALVLTGTLAVLALHVFQPTASISALRRTISEYAYSSLGWVFNGGVLAVSAGSLLIGVSLWLSGALRRRFVGGFALVSWSVALVVLVIFPKHDWSVGPSSHGTVHRIASLVAFLSVPLAAIALSRRRDPAWRWPAWFTLVGGVLAAGWLALILGAFVFGPLNGTPWWQVFPLGLVERGMAFSGVVAVLGLGWLALHSGRPPARQIV